MTIANNSSARRAGFRATNRGIEEFATITMTKFGTRTLYFPLSPNSFHLNGSGVINSADGIFSVITLPDANIGNMYTSFRLPAEWESGTDIIVSIYWKTSATSGAAKFTVQIGAKADGESTASSNTQNITTSASSTANKLNKSQVTFANSLFSASDWIGLFISRDPADAADTLAADLKIAGIVVEFIGRG